MNDFDRRIEAMEKKQKAQDSINNSGKYDRLS